MISLAGGITPLGDRNKVMLRRDNRIIVSALGPGTVLQNSPLQSGDQIFVPQRSWMSRNGQTFFVAALSVTTAVLVAVLVRDNNSGVRCRVSGARYSYPTPDTWHLTPLLRASSPTHSHKPPKF